MTYEEAVGTTSKDVYAIKNEQPASRLGLIFKVAAIDCDCEHASGKSVDSVSP